jgi:hypothetical protein
MVMTEEEIRVMVGRDSRLRAVVKRGETGGSFSVGEGVVA